MPDIENAKKNIANDSFEENLSGKPVLKDPRKLRILVAPLDWGLGHATRCIPIIKELISQQAEVWLAGEGAQEKLLSAEFPDLPFLSLPGYRIHYAKSTSGFLKNIFSQIPKILRSIKQENVWLKEMVVKYDFDAVIADNRYGLHHSTVPCIFITHQLRIKTMLGKWTETILQKKNYRFINRFTACWVPDEKGTSNLAGELSHPKRKPAISLHYIGVLSRLAKTNATGKKDHLLVILSGPEPQRSILENKIINDIVHYPGTATVVRGLPDASSIIPSTNSIKFYNHLPAHELNKEMEAAAYIISRAGYSTIMDIVTLQKKSILIPTPGQTEQMYLTGYLHKEKIAAGVTEKSFSLQGALQTINAFPYNTFLVAQENHLHNVITQFVQSLR